MINHIKKLFKRHNLVHPLKVKTQKEDHPPFVAPENWLENIGNEILTNLATLETAQTRVRPMALVRCARGGKTRALREIANWLKKKDEKLAVIFVSLNSFSHLRIGEEQNPKLALCRRIAYAARQGQDVPDSKELYEPFENAEVSFETIKKWLHKVRCVLLIDELNLFDAMNGNTLTFAGRELFDFLKNEFLMAEGRYFVFSSHVLSLSHDMSAFMDPGSARDVLVHTLPLIPSLDLVVRSFGLSDFDPRQALLYGLVPAMIYLARNGGRVPSKTREAIDSWKRAGIDNKSIVLLLSTFIDGNSDNVPNVLSQLMDTDGDATHEVLVRWIPYHMMTVLDAISKYSEEPLMTNLRVIVELFEVFKSARVASGESWEALFVLVLLIRVLSRRFHCLIDLERITKAAYRVTYNVPLCSDRLLSTITTVSDFLSSLPEEVEEGGQIAIYYPPHAQFEIYDVIVVVWDQAGLRVAIIGYQLREGGKIPAKEPHTEFASSFVISGCAAKKSDGSNGWALSSTNDISSFFGVSGKHWTPDRSKALSKQPHLHESESTCSCEPIVFTKN